MRKPRISWNSFEDFTSNAVETALTWKSHWIELNQRCGRMVKCDEFGNKWASEIQKKQVQKKLH